MWSPILNFSLLVLSFLGLAVTYLVSLQPKKREAKIGSKAWQQSKNLRTLGFFFEVFGTISLILSYWYPLSHLNWKIHTNPWVGLIISLIFGIPCLTIMMVGLLHAGKESWEPLKEGKMHGGIYKYIRHPQAIGEFPLFIAIAFGANSWFLVILMVIYNILFLFIMVRIEEADLIRRFGESYQEYQKSTGAFFPKLTKKTISKKKD